MIMTYSRAPQRDDYTPTQFIKEKVDAGWRNQTTGPTGQLTSTNDLRYELKSGLIAYTIL